MKLMSKGIIAGRGMDDRFAFCVPDKAGGLTFGPNLNPGFTWENLPEGTQSLAMICVDPDAPASGELVNLEGKSIPEAFPRADFYHWVVINIPADSKGIVEGGFSNGVIPGGKDDHHGAQETRQGINGYTEWFEDHPEMDGQYVGYDGPAPPWNDERVHRYQFMLYALGIDLLPLGYAFTAEDFLDEIEGLVLGQATLEGTYTLNPSLR